MANYSYVDHIGDGVTVTFPFSFVGPDRGYISRNDVYVFVDEVEVTKTFTGNNQVKLDLAPAVGAKVRIRRIMDKTKPYANFNRGNVFNKEYLNDSFLHSLYIYHEFLDGFLGSDPWKVQGDIDMDGNRIVNLGGALDCNDAVNLCQVLELIQNTTPQACVYLEGDMGRITDPVTLVVDMGRITDTVTCGQDLGRLGDRASIFRQEYFVAVSSLSGGVINLPFQYSDASLIELSINGSDISGGFTRTGSTSITLTPETLDKIIDTSSVVLVKHSFIKYV